MDGERWKTLIPKIARALEGRSSYEFKTRENICYMNFEGLYPVKLPDGRELGQMYTKAFLEDVYFDDSELHTKWRRRIKWMDDWIDPRSPFIDAVDVESDLITIRNDEVDLSFLCGVHYNLCFSPGSIKNKDFFKGFSVLALEDREDRMKVARFMPALVKDVNVFLKLINEVFSKHGYLGELLITDLDHPHYRIIFDSSGMSDEEVIDNVLKRAEAVIEFKKRFREWLAREERREYWEGTAIPESKRSIEMHKWRYMVKWPIELKDPEMMRRYERQIKYDLSDDSAVYNLDGYRLRLAKKTERGLKFVKLEKKELKHVGKVDEEEIDEEGLRKRDDIVVAINKRHRRLEEVSLEKIEFLKEDFPELFK
ncbi:MAG: hypothetical protein HA496_01000 [Thaumarchaeota archaeon]|nr:hypothetical protein [Nitrososphaerota archaeon]